MVCKVLLEPGSQFLEGRSAFCRERQQVKRVLNCVGGGSVLWRLLNHEIGIGTTEAKAAHPGKAWLLPPRPWSGLGRDDERCVLQRNKGIQLLKMRLGRNLLMFEAEQYFDQAGHSGGRLQVTDIGLDRTENALLLSKLCFPNNLRYGFDLDRVA